MLWLLVMAILTVSSCIPQSLTHRKENSSVSSKNKKNSDHSEHTMSSLACCQSCAVLQGSPCTPQYDFTPYMLSQHLLLSFPFHLFTWNHRNFWRHETSESFVTCISSFCSLPVLAGRGARRWTIFYCTVVNFGLGTLYSFAISA